MTSPVRTTSVATKGIQVQRIALTLACAIMVTLAGPAFAQTETTNRGAIPSSIGTEANSQAAEGIRLWAAGRYEAAVVAWQSPAENGDAESQFRLGQAYRDGQGVQIDTEKAISLLRKATIQGHLEAADEYGILLFQSGRVKDALAWIQDSAERGEPRAQYYLGIALFNGDDLEKNWVSAYALMTRAAASGLAPAVAALNQMDKAIPLEDRRKSLVLAEELENSARQNRARQMAATDLSAAPVRQGQSPANADRADNASLAAAVDSFFDSADRRDTPRKASTPAKVAAPAALPASTPRTPTPAKAIPGAWRVQLGAFSNKANADRVWSRLRTHRALAARKRFDVATGPILRLQAGPFASEGEARQTCSALATAHGQCLVLRKN